MTKQGFEVYRLYLAMQRHFSTDYDFFKYNGKVRVTTDSYSKRNDLFSFEKLSRLIPEEDYIDFFVAHFLENPKCWIRDMSKAKMEVYKAKIKNFPKVFGEDLEYLGQYNPPELVRVENDIPLIHKLAINGKVSIETVIAMDHFFPFIDNHAEKVNVSIMWPDHIMKLQKYRPFFVKHVGELQKDTMRSVFLNK